jgi:hypothetical protein
MGKKEFLAMQEEMQKLREENDRLLNSIREKEEQRQHALKLHEGSKTHHKSTEGATYVKMPTASWQLMNNSSPVPVARPADFIQLTPIVQPLPIVPYNTQEQPLAQYEDEYEENNY